MYIIYHAYAMYVYIYNVHLSFLDVKQTNGNALLIEMYVELYIHVHVYT